MLARWAGRTRLHIKYVGLDGECKFRTSLLLFDGAPTDTEEYSTQEKWTGTPSRDRSYRDGKEVWLCELPDDSVSGANPEGWAEPTPQFPI